MRPCHLLLALATLPLTLAACGGSSPAPQVSTFHTPTPKTWRVTSHPLGRGAFVPANVSFGPAGLSLRLPAGTLDGGEVQSVGRTGDGTYTARLRAAAGPGSISAFFLYQHDYATDSSDELDFEIPVATPPQVILTVWRRGIKVPVAQRKAPLSFDPAAGLHDYAFVRKGSHVSFTVDGATLFQSDKAPDNDLHTIFNAWYPTWQTPSTPPQEGTMNVARFTFAAP